MNKKIFFVILLSAAMLISPLAGIVLATTPYTDPTALAWSVDGSYSFYDMLRANHTYVPADKVANPVQKLTLSYNENLLTCDIKVGGVTYSLGKDFTYTGHTDYTFYNPSFADPTLGYYYPSVYGGDEATITYMYNFSAVPGGLEGTLSMLATMKNDVFSIVSTGGTGDFKNVQVKATNSPIWFEEAKLIVHTYHTGMVSGWPNAVPTFMTTNTDVTFAQLTDYCTNAWGLTSNPYPTFPANTHPEYHLFNIVIGDKFYLCVGCNFMTSSSYDPASKTVTLTYSDAWYLGDWYKGVAKMDQGFTGTIVVTLVNYKPANATATPPTPETYDVGPAVWNLQGFGALSGQSIIGRADGPLPYMVKGYAILPFNSSDKDNLPTQLMRSEIMAAAHWTENTPVAGGWIFATLAREPGLGNDAYLYVSGYHPFGAYAATFSGSDPDAKVTYSGNMLSVTTTINFTEVVGTTASYAQHDVTIQWTLPQIPKTQFGTYDWDKLCANDTWSDISATASINIDGSSSHSAFSTSDWATLGVLQPQKEAAIGHWIVDTPAPGGWVFAATGKDDTIAQNTWLYVAGYHPASLFGSAALYEALKPTGVTLNEAKNTITIPTTSLNFTQIQAGISSIVAHNVSATWTSNTQTNAYGGWKEANANISINIGGPSQHDVSASSWAIADFQS
jgi:hypothetical protein